MFRIYTTKKAPWNSERNPIAEPVSVVIAGCPVAGIAAIDFRRQHGIADAPNNDFDLLIDTTSESICRKYAARLNDASDLTIGPNNKIDIAVARRIAPATAAALRHPASEAVVILLVDDLLDQLAAAEQLAAEKAAAKEQALAALRAANREKYQALLADPGQIIKQRGTPKADTPGHYELRNNRFQGGDGLTDAEIQALIALADRIVADEEAALNAESDAAAARLRAQLDAKAAQVGGIFAERHLAGYTVDEEIIALIQRDELKARGLESLEKNLGREKCQPWEKPLTDTQFLELKRFQSQLPGGAKVTLHNSWDTDADDRVIDETDRLYAKAVYQLGEVPITARHSLGTIPVVATLD